jgi:hypothetical protein
MRVTRLDGCGRPVYGAASQVVTEGFVSVAVTAENTETDAVEVTNAGGKVCAREPGTSEFSGFSLEITFCDVQPCTFEMITGQSPVTDENGDTIGFRVNSKADKDLHAFALEIWAGVPGGKCGEGGSGSYGYILFPYISAGTLGDFTVENAAINFVITAAKTKDGNAWGAGPYEVYTDAGGDPTRLPELLGSEDHLWVIRTTQAPPAPTDGCAALAAPTAIPITGVTAGMPGMFVPKNADLPADLAALTADAAVGATGTAKPSTAWTAGQYIVLGDGSSAYWDGTAWASGSAG